VFRVVLQPNTVLVAEVIVGKSQTVIQNERGRRAPDDGYSSVQVCDQLNSDAFKM